MQTAARSARPADSFELSGSVRNIGPQHVLDDPLQLGQGIAGFGHVAEPLIAVHDAVPLAPVALRLGVQPDQGPGSFLDGGQQVQSRIGVV